MIRTATLLGPGTPGEPQVFIEVVDHPIYGPGWSTVLLYDVRWRQVGQVLSDPELAMVQAVLDKYQGWSLAQLAPELVLPVEHDPERLPSCDTCHDKLTPMLLAELKDLLVEMIRAGKPEIPASRMKIPMSAAGP